MVVGWNLPEYNAVLSTFAGRKQNAGSGNPGRLPCAFRRKINMW